jgi:hypothetical protein
MRGRDFFFLINIENRSVREKNVVFLMKNVCYPSAQVLKIKYKNKYEDKYEKKRIGQELGDLFV